MLVSHQTLVNLFGDNLQTIATRYQAYVPEEGKTVTLGFIAAEGSVELTPEGERLVKGQQAAPASPPPAQEEKPADPNVDVNDELSALLDD